jgi:hypothetical protein
MATSASAERDAVRDDAAPRAVRELAADLLPSTREISQGLVEHLTAALPELAAGDDELREEMLASAEANIDQMLRLLRADALVVPIEVAQYVRGLVRRGVTLPVLLRPYRLGHAWFWDRWSQALHDRIDSLEELLAAQEQSSAFMFAYVDRISDSLVEDYGSERERMARGARSCAETPSARSSPASRSTRSSPSRGSATSCAGTTSRCGCRAVRVRSAGWSGPRARPRPHWDRVSRS